jgi:hypothetical protein
MARVLPQASQEELAAWRSRAEADVYRSCVLLPDPMLVLHGLGTLGIGRDGQPRDGEADFVVLDPKYGLLVVEVKGGGVAFDAHRGRWTSIDRHGVQHDIHDPFDQARGRKHDVLRLIRSSQHWHNIGDPRLLACHCVMFPDLDDEANIIRADAPAAIVGGRRDLARFSAWVEGVFQFWTAREPGEPLGERGLQVVERILAASFAVQPRLGTRILAEDKQRAFWTDSQWQALQGMRHWKRLAVAGGAGTGKTLIAVRRAQELASEGRKTLLLCYNTGLGDFLKRENLEFTKKGGASDNLITTLTFHELCNWWCRVVGPPIGRDLFAEANRTCPGESAWDVQHPLALAYAVEVRRPDYDAVVVDEGQDFGEEFWLPIEMISESKSLTVFFDPNQDIYKRQKSFPVDADRTYYLQANCRNTGTIHELAYAYYAGPRVAPPPIAGPTVQEWHAPSLAATAKKIAAGVVQLVNKENVPRSDIAVLICDSGGKQAAYQALRAEMSRFGFAVEPERHDLAGQVIVDTVARFKGLEAAVVVLWLNSGAHQIDKRILYVGTSRPRSVLILAGEGAACRLVRQPVEAPGSLALAGGDNLQAPVLASGTSGAR